MVNARNATRPLARAICAFLLSASSAAVAAPVLDPAFGDHAVIQRDRPVPVSGSAAPGEMVTVTLGDRSQRVKADTKGRFLARFDPVTTTGPVPLSAESPSGRVVARGVLVGDVFLCSGQSNMEMEVRSAQDGAGQSRAGGDDQLRLMTVAKQTADEPRATFADAPAWQVASPDTVRTFSAACYYMVRDLRKEKGVPIGAIASSWGGSQISTWMGEGAQAAVGWADRSALLKLHARDAAAGERAAGVAWEAWWRKATGDKVGQEPWQPASPQDWAPVPSVGPWEQWGVPALADYNGMVWFRREVVLTAAQAKAAARIALGTLDDVGRVWINGKGVGMSPRAWQPNMFDIPAGVLRAGANVIIVNVQDSYANGGMEGPADDMKLTFGEADTMPLGEGWTYAIARQSPSDAPRVPWSDLAGAGTAYHAMIAPFGSIGLKGVAWYQGESDTDIPGYAGRMAAMMADWRRQFASPDLSFVIVQLAGYGKPATAPEESGWGYLRHAQHQAVAADAHAGLASAIDLGDPFDIHPGEKQELGRRLARAMRAVAYGDSIPANGPQAVSATADPGGDVTVRFAGLTGGLRVRSGDRPIAFELCGDGPGTCRYAAARVDGNSVTLSGDGRPVAKVRYAWADYAVVNLYDEAPLPVGPFEMAVSRP